MNEKQVDSTMVVMRALYETVLEFPDGAPAGPMYVACMQAGYSLEQFSSMMALLETARLVIKKGDLYFPGK